MIRSSNKPRVIGFCGDRVKSGTVVKEVTEGPDVKAGVANELESDALELNVEPFRLLFIPRGSDTEVTDIDGDIPELYDLRPRRDYQGLIYVYADVKRTHH